MKILNKKEENFLFLEEEWTNPVAENGVYKSTHTAMCTCGFHKKYTDKHALSKELEFKYKDDIYAYPRTGYQCPNCKAILKVDDYWQYLTYRQDDYRQYLTYRQDDYSKIVQGAFVNCYYEKADKHSFSLIKHLCDVDINKKEHTVNLNITKEYVVNYDCVTNELKIVLDGKEISSCDSNIKKALSYVYIFPENTIFDEIKKNMLRGLNPRMFDAVSILRKHPQMEILYNTYGENLSTYRYINKDLLLEETKPAKIMGLTNPVWNEYRKSLTANSNLGLQLENIRYIEKNLGEKKAIDYAKTIRLFSTYSRNSAEALFWLITECGYTNIERLKQYIFADTCMYQGITDAATAISYLEDYVNISKTMNVPYEKYPKSLKLAHDVINANKKLIIDDELVTKFKDTVSKKEYSDLEYKTKDFEVIAPKTPKEVLDEGVYQHHCVGSYNNWIADGKTKILFMRKPSDPGTPWMTIDVRDGELFQFAGFGDRNPTEEEEKFIKVWQKEKHIA